MEFKSQGVLNTPIGVLNNEKDANSVGMTVAKKDPETTRALRKLEAIVLTVMGQFSTLEVAVTPILSQPSENKGISESADPEFYSEVAQKINQEVRNLEVLSLYMKELISRVEL